MLHAVTLHYLSTEDEISSHLDAHKQWLVRGLNEGKIVFAGPLNNGSGGYILFHSDDVGTVHTFLEEDPFVKYKIVDIDVVSVEPALRAQDLPEKWAGKARLI